MVTICHRLFWNDILIHEQPQRLNKKVQTGCVSSGISGTKMSKQAQVNQRATQVGRRITTARPISLENRPRPCTPRTQWPLDDWSHWPVFTAIKWLRRDKTCNASEWFWKDPDLAGKCCLWIAGIFFNLFGEHRSSYKIGLKLENMVNKIFKNFLARRGTYVFITRRGTFVQICTIGDFSRSD